MRRPSPLTHPDDVDLGTPMPQEKAPWLSQRQYEQRRTHETTLYDPNVGVDSYTTTDLQLTLDLFIAKAKLDTEEEFCFRRSQEYTVEEIAVMAIKQGFKRLGAKTVRRRIASALVKLRKLVSVSA